ncbi:MAG TPA: MarR family transcriptional regulator [Steroidobacteraceae bacterium]|nr:MarR family transcriptional regulator [Steroidobacteraceae bacterium]
MKRRGAKSRAGMSGSGRRGRREKQPRTVQARAPAGPSALLEALKREGPLTIRALARTLGVTYEAARQQIAELTRAGSVAASESRTDGATGRRPGPASRSYRVSAAAEHLFPKHYDELTAELVQLVRERFGGAGLAEILSRMTEARVRRWAPRLEGLGLKEKLKVLTALYEDKDAYMQVEWRDGAPALIERNCPFLSVAQKHPAICSVSVNTLERLLGCRVVREQRFQAGHGKCVFRLRPDEVRSSAAEFALEP